MTQRRLPILAVIALALPLSQVVPGPIAAQDGECLSGHEIQDAINAGRIVPLAEAMAAAGIDDEPIGRANVCQRAGTLEYRVNIMDAYGGSDTRVLNAQGG